MSSSRRCRRASCGSSTPGRASSATRAPSGSLPGALSSLRPAGSAPPLSSLPRSLQVWRQWGGGSAGPAAAHGLRVGCGQARSAAVRWVPVQQAPGAQAGTRATLAVATHRLTTWPPVSHSTPSHLQWWAASPGVQPAKPADQLALVSWRAWRRAAMMAAAAAAQGRAGRQECGCFDGTRQATCGTPARTAAPPKVVNRTEPSACRSMRRTLVNWVGGGGSGGGGCVAPSPARQGQQRQGQQRQLRPTAASAPHVSWAASADAAASPHRAWRRGG